jgi:hypothetical protein
MQVRSEGNEIVFAIVREGLTNAGDDSPTSRTASLGLGMALARRDLDRMGARMEFERSEQGRACLRVWVPLSPDPNSVPAALPSAKKNVATEEPRTRPHPRR